LIAGSRSPRRQPPSLTHFARCDDFDVITRAQPAPFPVLLSIASGNLHDKPPTIITPSIRFMNADVFKAGRRVTVLRRSRRCCMIAGLGYYLMPGH